MKFFINKLSILKYLVPGRIIRKIPSEKRKYFYVGIGALIVVLVPLIFGELFFPKGTKAAWADENWAYRKSISISAHTSEEQNVFLNLTGADDIDTSDTTKFQMDCGDLRFTKENGEALPYYIVSGCGSIDTVVHVNFDVFPAGAQTIYMYYGNPSAIDGFSMEDFSTAASSVTMGSMGSEEKAPAPIMYWKFDEGYGNVASDSASFQMNMGLFNSPTWQADDVCVVTKCLLFDGTNDSGRVMNDRVPTGDFTYAAWIRPTTVTDDSIISILDGSGGKEFKVYIDSAAKVVIMTNNTTALTTTSQISENMWSYLVVRRSGSTITVFINGKVDPSTGSDGTALNFSTCNLFIGMDPDSGCAATASEFFNGFIDDLKIYSYARSTAQILADFTNIGSSMGSSVVLGMSAQAYLSNGLVGYWKQDAFSGSDVDSSGNTNTLVAVNTPTYVGGVFGNSGNYESSSSMYQRLNSNSIISLYGDITMAAWIKPESNVGATQYDIMGKWDGANESYLLSQFGDEIRVYIDSSSNYVETTSANLQVDSFYHVATTYASNSGVLIYLNGKQQQTVTTGTIPSSITIDNGRFHVAAEDSTTSADNFYDGLIDEVRLYKRVFTPSEIEDLYNFAPEPYAYWKLDEKSGRIAADSSGYSAPGRGGGTTEWVAGKIGGSAQFDDKGTSIITADPSKTARKYVTIAGWVNFDEKDNLAITDQNHALFGWNFDLMLKFRSGAGAAYFIGVAGTAISTNDINFQWAIPSRLRGWHHIAATYDGTISRLYFDGEAVSSQTRVAAPGNGISNLNRSFTIGGNIEMNQWWEGRVDDVRAYNYALTQKQVIKAMNIGSPLSGTLMGTMTGYWKFDEGNGTLARGSANQIGIVGTLSNMASPATVTSGWSNNGKFNKALRFDGTNDFVTFRDPVELQITRDVTISSWINLATNNTIHDIVAKWSTAGQFGYRLYTDANGKLNFEMSQNGTATYLATSSAVLSTNTWHHVAGVYEIASPSANTSLTVYVDGVKEGFNNTDIPSSMRDSTANFLVGAENAGATNNMSGAIDEVKVYTAALTADEIKMDFNYNSSLNFGAFGIDSFGVASKSATAVYCVPGDTTQACSPVGEWRFEERQGTTANDTSSNSNTGTLTNRPVFVPGKIGSALSFVNLSSQSVNVANTINGVKSVSFWVKPTSDTSSMFALTGSGYITASGGTITATGFTSPTIYVNGKVSSSLTAGSWQQVVVTTGTGINGSAIRMGLANSVYFDGVMDEVRVYDYTLTPSQVAWNYNRGKPIAHYKMDECQGSSVKDSSGNGLTGTIGLSTTGTQTTALGMGTCTTNASTPRYNGRTGKYNPSLNFDGTSDGVSLGDTSFLEFQSVNSFSAAGWVKTSGTVSSDSQIIGKMGGSTAFQGWWLGLNNVGAPYVVLRNDNVTNNDLKEYTTTEVDDTGWHHVAFSYNGSSSSTGLKIYIDGVERSTTVQSNGLTGEIQNTTANASIGYRDSTSSNYFPGQIDDVQVFNYSLTSAQIRNLYNQSSAVRFGPLTGTP